MPLIDPATSFHKGRPISPTSKLTSSALTSQPIFIELLPTTVANVVHQVHPALLLSACWLRFDSLVSDPVSALLTSLIPLTLVQVMYVATCLPAVGSAASKRRKQIRFGTKRNVALTSNTSTIILALLLALLATIPLTLLLILFGAPITTHLAHTTLLAAHTALLALFPLLYMHGTATGPWRAIATLSRPLDPFFGAALGAFAGLWFGAVPIPLDWDRPWQRWPVPLLSGLYLGYFLGRTGGTWCRGVRLLE